MNLVYDIAGAGRPIILLHGGFTHRQVFGYQLLGLSRTSRVVVPDLPGYGQSPWDSAVSWPQQAVDGVLQLVADLQLREPVVAGWSLAGPVAAQVVEQVEGARLVLIGVSADPPGDDAIAATRDRLAADFPRYTRTIIRRFTSSGVSLASEEWLFEMALATGADVHAAALDAAAVPLGSTLPDGTVSIVGAHDQIVPPASSPTNVGEQIVFERSGHCPFLEEAERFNAVVTEVLTT